MTRWFISICFFLCACVPHSDRAKQNRSTIDSQYEKLLSSATIALEENDISQARDLFLQADEMKLHEVPNYRALLGLAKIDCKLGNYKKGTQLVHDFICMLDVEVGIRHCKYNDNIQGIENESENHLSELCTNRMCSEIYLNYYENPTKKMKTEVFEMRKDALDLLQRCK